MGRIGTDRGIESQFWNIQEPEPLPFNLDVKIVDEFPEAHVARAISLLFWGFRADKKIPTVVGFPMGPGGQFEQPVPKAYATINGYGNMKEMIAFNYSYSFKLNLDFSASRILMLHAILKHDGHPFFDSEGVKDLVYNLAVKQGLVKE